MNQYINAGYVDSLKPPPERKHHIFPGLTGPIYTNNTMGIPHIKAVVFELITGVSSHKYFLS